MKVKVRFFASYRDRTGVESVSVDLPHGASVGDLIQQLCKMFPHIATTSDNVVVAVNAEYATHDQVVHSEDEVALIPPVSGGENMIKLTNHPLIPQDITGIVSKDTNGAVVTFLGTTRLFNDGRRVLYLEYEVYSDMASKTLEEIRQEVQRLWGIKDIAIWHRVGKLEIGEVSLVVALSSPHRKEAFEACEYVVDQLKKRVPIWKKEVFEGGYVWIGSQNQEHNSVRLDN